MKQLNNTNGQSIVIDKIDHNSGRVVYSVYEYDNTNRLSQDAKAFTDLIDYPNQTISSFDEVYSLLASEIDGFSVSEDVQNLTINTGSTGRATVIRVYIPSNLLNRIVNTDDPLNLLIKAMAPLSSWSQRLENGTLQYLETLENDAKTLLEAYENQGVVIQHKI